MFVAQAAPGDLPSWITKGPVSDASFHYVVCSHDGIDPEEARQIAESKCLASAAKLGGVNVRLTQKTVQSLTGSDSSEVAEIEPIETRVKCEGIDRFLEKIKDGFRVWLRCGVPKPAVLRRPISHDTAYNSKLDSDNRIEGTLVLSTVPLADRILVIGQERERVIEPSSNIVVIKVSSLDAKIEVKKTGFKVGIVHLPKILSHGQRFQMEILLEPN